MNACHHNMYMERQKLKNTEIQLSSQEMPKINTFVHSLPSFPIYKLEHILVAHSITDDAEETKQEEDASLLQSLPLAQSPKLRLHSKPDCILSDWLYMGCHAHCKSLDILRELGITHILCCSDVIPTYFMYSSDIHISYARVPVIDVNCANVYDYFYAAKQFIDLCNPLLCSEEKHVQTDAKKKILVHCEMGISRSASMVIAYLLSSKVRLNEDEMWKLQYIQKQLDAFERDEVNEYRVKQAKGDNIVYMKLNEAYYYTQSCRAVMEPNMGFCKQLEKWERIAHGKRSTLQDLPKYTPYETDNDRELGKTASRLLATKDVCSCVLL